MELSTFIVTGADDGSLPTGYKSVGDVIVNDGAWDRTAEFLIYVEVKKDSYWRAN